MVPDVRERCGLLTRRLHQSDPLARAAEVIESAIHDRATHLSSADFLAGPSAAPHAGPDTDSACIEQAVAYKRATATNYALRPNTDKLSNLSPEQVALLLRRLQQKKGRD